ncbi:LysM peptidoglycan-binding domain-containing protein [Actinokineospora inagensis]|uniref:LysM peptidoglycan-binding domain-containing protein n=1 Tax=Actinokineospora inagensis TaxID=103730 RepID=UPI0003F4F357|nr:LysM peptidoglycan-binding domain-containing protein [Actinokineospora inagensis]
MAARTAVRSAVWSAETLPAETAVDRRLRLVPDAPARTGRVVGQGRLRPPTRRRDPAAAHVVAAAECGPRKAPMPVLVMIAVAVAVAAVVYGIGLAASSMAGRPEIPSTTTVVRVAPGESLSEIAVRMVPDGDPGDVVRRIQDLNGLSDPTVRPGQALTVPTSG